jgi:hypothetical protein
MTRWIILLSTSLLLSGCCSIGGGCGAAPSTSLAAWDGQGPELSDQPRQREFAERQPSIAVGTAEPQSTAEDSALARLPKNSPEWWALHDKIQADADAKLARQLVICTGCSPASAGK